MKVVKGLPARWGMCSRTILLGGFTRTLSCWDNTIAVGSGHGDIIILDAITGSQTAVLSGHTGQVNCVTFSLDGTSLVSGSNDCTVKLWDVQTGGVVKTFSGHTLPVGSVSISANCSIIASGSMDETIHLWNVQTEECQYIIEQQGWVDHIHFSPINPQHLISICNGKLWQWDINGCQINPPSNSSHISFSLDGTRFVSCHGAVVTVQTSDSGAIVAIFQVAKDDIQRCCFSLDGRLVAVAARHTIYIWNVTSSTPHLVGTFLGHTGSITSLGFSSPSTLISASMDKSIKFWQISTPSKDPAMSNPRSTPTTLPLISSISLQARDGVAISSDTDGVVKVWDIPASLCKASPKSPAEDYKHGDAKLINIKLVFVWCGGGSINVWDPKKGKFLWQKDVPEDGPLDLRISGDGSKIFYIDRTGIQALDMWTGESERTALPFGIILNVKLLAMDGSKVWMEYQMMDPEGWDFGILGSPPIKLSTMPPNTLYLNDSKLWDNTQYRIQDMVTGKVVFQLSEGLQSHIVEVQWNGQYLVISLKSETEFILELPPAFLLQ